MADALLSPVVGGAMLAATAGLAAYSIKRMGNDMDEKKVPLMGVMGAFVFATQMINFSIPGTGSSGHLGGGLLLAIMLGPYAGFLTMTSVLLIQALVFADGGLLALGSNIFNLGFYTCFVVYPLIYRRIVRRGYSPKRIFLASMLSAVIGLQMGAFSVVLETFFSGRTDLPFGTFVLLMQPIHLAIGLVEGLVTSAIVSFVWKARPEIIEEASVRPLGRTSIRMVAVAFAVAAVIIGGGLSWFASHDPDGLEWSIAKVTGKSEIETSDPIHKTLAAVQGKTAVLPDYGLKPASTTAATSEGSTSSSDRGTGMAGAIGGGLTLGLAVLTGLIIKVVKRRKSRGTD